MPPDSQMRLQDTFLSHLMTQKTPITVFLVNGIKLQGIVTAFDNFCIALSRDGQMQTVYKQAISTIMPAVAVALWEDNSENDAKPAAKPSPAAPKRPTVVVERRTRRPPT